MVRSKALVQRIVLAALAGALGLSTLIAGLGNTSFLVASTGTEQAVAAVRADGLDSTIKSGLGALSGSTTVVDSSSGGWAGDSARVANLDAGLANKRIDQWVHRLTTSLKL